MIYNICQFQLPGYQQWKTIVNPSKRDNNNREHLTTYLYFSDTDILLSTACIVLPATN